jgi:hypothetical protein
MSVLELVGQRFGRLVVKSRSKNSTAGKTRWSCLCDCGTQKIVIGGDLKSGRTLSCGCFKRENSKRLESLNLIGQKFGRLLVIKQSSKNDNHKTYWLCQCDCGKTTTCQSGHLTSGNSYSCGCYQREMMSKPDDQLVGQRFGRLVVKSFDGRNLKGVRYWLCQCDCGSLKRITTGHLLQGNIISCGCLKSGMEEKVSKWLIKAGLRFEREKRFQDCKRIRTLPFDFCVDGKFLIECQGHHHYRSIAYYGGESSYQRVKENDKIKADYCKFREIPLLTIPYWDRNEIESILKDFLLN